jgi:Amt family ammonium transporter
MENNIFELQYALDTFYFLVTGALVMWMAAGFAMLEAGLVRSKNTTEILLKNISLYAVACTMYMVCGYSIMYGGGEFTAFLSGIVADGVAGAEEPATYAPSADFFFQVVFVATAMSIVSGAVAERMKLWAFLAFAVFMTGVIYPMEGSWTWGGNAVFGMYTLGDLGFSDFAGSGIVHMAGAAAALAGVLLLGARKGKYGPTGQINAIPGANLPLATLGTFTLWLGWFGFNGGSVLSADPGATSLVLVTTCLAGAAGGLGAMIAYSFVSRKPDLSMALNGILAGLVGITAGADVTTPMSSLIVGGIAGVLVVAAVILFDRAKLDDPVGATSVHLVCGIWGTLAVGIFSTNPEHTFLKQLAGVGAYGGFAALSAFVIFYAIKKTMGLRVVPEEERDGLDSSEHEMHSYEIQVGVSTAHPVSAAAE